MNKGSLGLRQVQCFAEPDTGCLNAKAVGPGARASVNEAKKMSEDEATPEQLWIRDLVERKSFGKSVVAIGNKHAR